MTTYMVRARDGIRVGATGLHVTQGYPVTDGQIGNRQIVAAMLAEGALEEINDLRAHAMEGLIQVPGIYPQLAINLLDEGIPTMEDIEAAERQGRNSRLVALEAVINADLSQLVKVAGIGQTKVQRLQEDARAIALRMGR